MNCVLELALFKTIEFNTIADRTGRPSLITMLLKNNTRECLQIGIRMAKIGLSGDKRKGQTERKPSQEHTDQYRTPSNRTRAKRCHRLLEHTVALRQDWHGCQLLNWLKATIAPILVCANHRHCDKKWVLYKTTVIPTATDVSETSTFHRKRSAETQRVPSAPNTRCHT